MGGAGGAGVREVGGRGADGMKSICLPPIGGRGWGYGGVVGVRLAGRGRHLDSGGRGGREQDADRVGPNFPEHPRLTPGF